MNIFLFSVATLLFSTLANAGYIICGDIRTAGLGDAAQCSVSSGGEAHESDLTAAFGGSWTDVGAAEGTPSGTTLITGDYFNVALTFGTWGQPLTSGSWTIDGAFWGIYDSAVISMHVGGGGDSLATDQWLWKITQGEIIGNWDYLTNTSATGGGLSNLHLWGGGTTVSEPGTVALLGLGLYSLFISRRKRSKA